MSKVNVLMVCLGNICRSPLAEGILRHKAQALNLDIHVDSAGTSNNHSGEQPDKRSILIAQKNGIDISHQRARQITTNDLDFFDYILVMDNMNLRNVLNLSQGSHHSSKVSLASSFCEQTDLQAEVPDPYYGGVDGFSDVFKQLSHSIDAFISRELA